MTAKPAAERNRFVVDQDDALLIVRAAPGSQTEVLADDGAFFDRNMKEDP